MTRRSLIVFIGCKKIILHKLFSAVFTVVPGVACCGTPSGAVTYYSASVERHSEREREREVKVQPPRSSRRF